MLGAGGLPLEYLVSNMRVRKANIERKWKGGLAKSKRAILFYDWFAHISRALLIVWGSFGIR